MLSADNPQWTLYYMPENGLNEKAVNPFGPEFIHGVIGLINQTVEAVPFDTERTSSSDIMLGIPPDKTYRKGVIIGEIGGFTGNRALDTFSQIWTVTDQEFGIVGDSVLILRDIEGRDDRPRKDRRPFHSPQIKKDANILAAVEQKPLAAIFIWDMHSLATKQILIEHNKNRNTPVYSLTATRLFADEFKSIIVNDQALFNELHIDAGDDEKWNAIKNMVKVVAPDLGSVEKNRILAVELGVDLIFANKFKPRVNESDIEGYFQVAPDGSFTEIDPASLEKAILCGVDDIDDTHGTIKSNCHKLKEEFHAKRAYFAATHAVFGPERPEAAEMNITKSFEEGYLDGLLITDSLPTHTAVQHEKIRTLSLVEPTAALIKWIAGKASVEEIQLVNRCLYESVMDKFQLFKSFSDRKFIFDGHRASEDMARQIQVLFQYPV